MPIKLGIKDYSSGGILRVWEWVPRSADEVYFQLTLDVGEAGKIGGNLLQLIVATPTGIERFRADYPNVDPCPNCLLVIEKYSWQAVVNEIDRELARCSKDSWQESIRCLSKRFDWEYEGY